MFDHHHRLAGICHALLPECGGGGVCLGRCPKEYRYVDCSIRGMLKTFGRHSITGKEIEVKCFGGSDMFPQNIRRQGAFSVGKQNIVQAEKVIAEAGLTILAKDVGGFHARKILFHTHTGEVFLKRLGTAYYPEIIQEIF
jgi:chemotaxis protein CheD